MADSASLTAGLVAVAPAGQRGAAVATLTSSTVYRVLSRPAPDPELGKMTPVEAQPVVGRPYGKEWVMLTGIESRTGWRAALGRLLAGALLCGPAWALAHGLTPEELGRLVKVVGKHGSRAVLPRDVISILQLKPAQLAPDVKEATWQDEDGTKHGFAPLNDGSGYFMFTGRPTQGQTVYVVDTDLHLVHAARTLVKGAPMIALPEAEAQQELDEEFSRWSKMLSPAGPSMAPKKPLSGPGVPSDQAAPYPFKQSQQTKP
ncbi:MAG TPA: hypothetical protein VH278_17285 [Burkholderiaceae bacterium]|jgi:hypothetical protein|nr:hypothetical protein [Burkholderiaceae bacterium]